MASISAALAISRSPFPSAARSPLSFPSRFKGSSLSGISTSSWCAGLGAFGFLETRTENRCLAVHEAVKILDYVECFLEGAGKGRKMAKVCTDAAIEGFPKLIIKDKVLSGEQELPDLAEASGFSLEDPRPS